MATARSREAERQADPGILAAVGVIGLQTMIRFKARQIIVTPKAGSAQLSKGASRHNRSSVFQIAFTLILTFFTTSAFGSVISRIPCFNVALTLSAFTFTGTLMVL